MAFMVDDSKQRANKNFLLKHIKSYLKKRSFQYNYYKEIHVERLENIGYPEPVHDILLSSLAFIKNASTIIH